MLTFHVNIYARPSGLAPHPDDAGVLHWMDPRRIFDAFLPVSFEDAAAALANLPRIDVEPDGFFIFSGNAEEGSWQVSGHLFDFGDRLHRMELHGACPAADLQSLLECILGNHATDVVFELVEAGVVAGAKEFFSRFGK